MTEHLCGSVWVDGPVVSCSQHTRQTSAPDVRPYDDRRTRLRVDGVAKTGGISPKGTVEHTDYYSGRMAVTAKPSTVHVKMMELPWFRERFVYREGRLIEKATGKEVAWTRDRKQPLKPGNSPRSKPTSLKPRNPVEPTPRSGPSLRRPGVSIGRNGASLPGSNPLQQMPLPSPKR